MSRSLVNAAATAIDSNPLGDEESRKVEKPVANSARCIELARSLFGIEPLTGSVRDLDSYDDRNFYCKATSSRPELKAAADCHACGDPPGSFHFVVKVHNGVESLSPGFIECQNLAMELVRAAGVWCPRALPSLEGRQIAFAEQPLADGSVRRHAVRCLPYRPACLLGSALPGAALLRELGGVTARVSCALSAFDHPEAHRTFIWDLAQTAAIRPSPPPLRGRPKRRPSVSESDPGARVGPSSPSSHPSGGP